MAIDFSALRHSDRAEKALQAEAVQRFKSGDGKHNSPHCLCRLMYRQRRLSQHVTYRLPHSTVSSRAVTQHATLELHLFQTRSASGLSSQQTAVGLRVGHLPVETRKVLDNSLHLRCLQTQAVLHAARQWRCLQTEAAQQAEETFVILTPFLRYLQTDVAMHAARALLEKVPIIAEEPTLMRRVALELRAAYALEGGC